MSMTSAASPTQHTLPTSSRGHAAHRSDPRYSRRSNYDPQPRSPAAAPSSARPPRPHLPDQQLAAIPPPHSQHPTSSRTAHSHQKPALADDSTAHSEIQPPPRMVDVGTQYSPPTAPDPFLAEKKTPSHSVAKLRIADSSDITPGDPDGVGSAAGSLSSVSMTEKPAVYVANESPSSRGKRPAVEDPKVHDKNEESGGEQNDHDLQHLASKRLRPETPAVRLMPIKYETCNPHDLAIIISSMLMELIRFNDAIPLRDGHLTRFHSRAPPGISVSDYLQRLTTHATLSPPILLSMVYYIDKLCALYPAFTINSLTVHRFLITSATVGSKGLSDSFWTNKVYARCGGVSLKELALLELEFLSRVDWRIVPKPEVLVDYYRSLIERTDGYELDVNENSDEAAMLDTHTA